jgi:hypothetical protein
LPPQCNSTIHNTREVSNMVRIASQVHSSGPWRSCRVSPQPTPIIPGRVAGTLHQGWGGCQAPRTLEDRGGTREGEGKGDASSSFFFFSRAASAVKRKYSQGREEGGRTPVAYERWESPRRGKAAERGGKRNRHCA